MKKTNRIKRWLTALLVVPILLILTLITLLYAKQDAIVQELLSHANADFKGEVQIKGSHISLFENLPYISIDLDELKIYEDKTKKSVPIVNISDIYLGFDLLTILSGKMDIRSIKLKNGKIELVQDKDGQLNILKAFEPLHPIKDAEEEFHLDLRSVQLEKIDISKLNGSNGMMVETFITHAESRFRTSADHLMISLDSKLVLNVIQGGDTTFFKHKHIDIDTKLDYDKKEEKLSITASTLQLEHVNLGFEGSADFTGDPDLDIRISGNKPNFDLFMAFAPEELLPALAKYDNKGKINFNASLKGKVTAHQMPHILVEFSCQDAFLQNTETGKKLEALNFKASFSNGDSAKLSTMRFSLLDFSSKPEAGIFSGHLVVNNFETPEIETKIISDFDLGFLSKFLGVKDLQDLEGNVKLSMNFHDIVDLSHPEKAIEKFNEAYFTQLNVKGLGFKHKDFDLPVKDVNINATLTGHEAVIKQFDIRVGKSDLSINGSISDLPAILHHTGKEVRSSLNISSRFLDIRELTAAKGTSSTPIDEQIENLRLNLAFKSSAKAFTESPNLPVGEFIVENLYAKFKHYPHTLHDFHADLMIDSSDFRIIDFKGMVDKSDFHFSGRLKNYDLWFADTAKGDTRMDFDLSSVHLKLEDLFAYKGENYVPPDYRHEELSHLKLHGHVLMHFNGSLKSTDLYLDEFAAKMKMHHYRFEKFKGRVHFEDEHLVVQDFSGKLGKSEFKMDLNYYLGKDEKIRKRDNHFNITAKHLDFDELFSYNTASAGKTMTPAEHEKGFNIYELPFTNMTFDFDIAHLNYHRYLIHDLKGKMRSTKEHYLYIDQLALRAADGSIKLKGYFNGSDKEKIYFSPDLTFDNLDLDKLLFKFENFGQDHFVSENIHGKITGRLTGQLRMHRDLVPIIDQSELHLDMQVTEGRLDKYAPLTALADYFGDKNVSRVAFDTLKNHIDMNKGTMSFPVMTINSTLGFIDVSGKQDMNGNMDYYIKIPMKLVTTAARQKLFGPGKESPTDPEQVDEIQYKDESKKIKYVNLRLSGNTENYKISMAKNKGG